MNGKDRYDWNRVATRLAGRNALDIKDPKYLSHEKVTWKLIKKVNRVTGLSMPDKANVKVEDINAHASVGGGWDNRKGTMTEKPVRFTMGQRYLENALDSVRQGTPDFAPFKKLVRTVSHEMTHVGQRSDPNVMSTTTSAQREMQAYGSEITQHPLLPALTGNQLTSTRNKFTNKALERGAGITEDERRLAHRVMMQDESGRGVGLD